MKLVSKSELVLCTLVVVVSAVLAAPQNAHNVQLLEFESKNVGLGTYSFAYKQSDHSSYKEKGELRNAGAENEFVAVKGSFMWIAPDDHIYEINYTADEKGYQPTISVGVADRVSPAVAASVLGLN